MMATQNKSSESLPKTMTLAKNPVMQTKVLRM